MSQQFFQQTHSMQLGYIDSGKQVYVPEYTELVKTTSTYQACAIWFATAAPEVSRW